MPLHKVYISNRMANTPIFSSNNIEVHAFNIDGKGSALVLDKRTSVKKFSIMTFNNLNARIDPSDAAEAKVLGDKLFLQPSALNEEKPNINYTIKGEFYVRS